MHYVDRACKEIISALVMVNDLHAESCWGHGSVCVEGCPTFDSIRKHLVAAHAELVRHELGIKPATPAEEAIHA